MLHIFDSTDKKKTKSHIRNIIHMATIDGKMDCREIDIIKKFSKRFGITNEEYEQILADDREYDYHPPVELEERFLFLYDMFIMILADDVVARKEIELFKLTAISLNFNYKRIDDIVSFFRENVTAETNPEAIFPAFKKLVLRKDS